MTDLLVDEDELRRLLAAAADAVPAPGRAPDDLLAALAADAGTDLVPQRGLQWAARPRVLALAAAVLVVVVALGALAIGDSGDGDAASQVASERLEGRVRERTSEESDGDESAQEAPMLTTTMPSGGAGGLASGTGGGQVLSADPFADDESAGGDSAGQPAPGAPAARTDSSKVVKTGAVELEVKRGAVPRAMEQLVAKANGLQGYVAESSSADASGTLVLRVPAHQFDQLLIELRKLGDVVSETTKGTEVSAQFTDLQARLAAVTATRDQLRTVLSDAKSVPDILAVQDRLTVVQTEIEQVQGQLRLLEDQVAMGTLSVSLYERGADATFVDEEERGLGAAWDDARHRFGDGLEDLVAWSGSAGVVVLVLALLALLGRLLWPWVRRMQL